MPTIRPPFIEFNPTPYTVGDASVMYWDPSGDGHLRGFLQVQSAFHGMSYALATSGFSIDLGTPRNISRCEIALDWNVQAAFHCDCFFAGAKTAATLVYQIVKKPLGAGTGTISNSAERQLLRQEVSWIRNEYWPVSEHRGRDFIFGAGINTDPDHWYGLLVNLVVEVGAAGHDSLFGSGAYCDISYGLENVTFEHVRVTTPG